MLLVGTDFHLLPVTGLRLIGLLMEHGDRCAGLIVPHKGQCRHSFASLHSLQPGVGQLHRPLALGNRMIGRSHLHIGQHHFCSIVLHCE